MSQPPVTKIDVWINRAKGLAVLVLLTVFALLIWRLSALAQRIEQTVSAISSDVELVASTAADLSQRIDILTAKIDALKQKSEDLIHRNEVESLVDQFNLLQEGYSGSTEELSEESKREIKDLMSVIRKFEGKFRSDGEYVSPTWLYLKLQVKYKTYEPTIHSAEDFIDRVATKTLTSSNYEVVHPDGENESLAELLRRNLRAYRRQDL